MRMKKAIVFLGLAVAFSSMAMDKESSTAKLEGNEFSPATVTAPALPVEGKCTFNEFLEDIRSRVEVSRLLNDNRKFRSNLLETIKGLDDATSNPISTISINTVVLSTVYKTITVDSEGNVISESETVVDPENQE